MGMPNAGGHNAAVETVLDLTEAGTGDSGLLRGYGPGTRIRAQLEVTAVAGTDPTLDVVIEDTLDGTTFNTIGTFAQATGATREVINVTNPFAHTLRVKHTVGGTDTPTFDFSVKWVVD